MLGLSRSHQRKAAGATLALVVALAGLLHAQAPGRQTGIYLEAAGKSDEAALVRLESNMMQPEQKGMLGATLTGGLMGVESIGVLEGPRADLRLETGASSFQFLFEAKGKRMPKMPTNLDEALENTWDTSSMPPTADSPKDFGLIKLEVKDDSRRVSMGKVGGLTGGRGKPKGLIECTVQEIGPNTYRVKPKTPLADGEYAFVYLEQGGGFAWDFGVDR